MKPSELTTKQKEFIEKISIYADEKTQNAYRGSIHALNQENYPDRLSHFAYSLRDVIDSLVPNRKQTIKQALRLIIDPLDNETLAFKEECKTLNDNYTYLSGIGHSKTEISNEKAHEILSIVEHALGEITERQPKLYSKIDKIVTQKPSLENAEKLVKMNLLTVGKFKLVEKLSVDWLEHMHDAGFFENPHSLSSKGEPEWKAWAPSDYLIKCVDKFPNKVTNIILSCSSKCKKFNIAVYQNFLTCALQVPIECTEKIGLKAFNEEWFKFIESPHITENYFELVEKLYMNGKYHLAIKLVHSAFIPKYQIRMTTTPYGGLIKSEEAIGSLNDYCVAENFYEKIPKLSQKNPKPIIKLIISVLNEYIRIENQIAGMIDKRNSNSDSWCPSIEELDQNQLGNIRSTLVFHLRNCLLDIGNTNIKKLKNIMKIINKQNYYVYRRLELYVYEQFTTEFDHETIKSFIEYFNTREVYHEYYNLIKKSYVTLPIDIKYKIIELIDKGFEPEILKQIKDTEGKNIAESREKCWKIRHFTPIKDHLDKKHVNIYSKLTKELNMPSHTDYFIYYKIIERESSIDTNLFKGKKIEEIFEIAKNTPFENPLLSDNKIPLTFKDYVKNNSLECSKKSLELENANSNIQYMLFSGLEKAVKEDKEINWEVVLKLIKNIVPSIDKNHVYQIYDHILSICDLIKIGLEKNSINFQLKDKIWEIIQLLVEISTNTSEFNRYTNKNEAFTVSINNSNGKSFYIIYQYSIWCQTYNKTKGLQPEIKEIFDDYLNEKSIHTISRSAVLGLTFKYFYNLDRPWTKMIFAKIRPKENMRIAFWDGYVRNGYNKEIFENEFKLYNEFLCNKSIKTNELKFLYNLTIDHVVYAYLHDWKYAKNMVENFLKQQTNNENELYTEHFIYQVGKIIQSQNSNLKIKEENLIYLLKHKLFSKYDLTCWLDYDAINKEEIISLYLKYFKKYKKKFNLVTISCDMFSPYIKSFNIQVAKCINILITKRDGNYIPDEEIKHLLKLLLAIKNEQTIKICKLIINKISLTGRNWDYLLKLQ